MWSWTRRSAWAVSSRPPSPSVSEPAAGPGAALFIGTFHNAVALLTGSQPANPPLRADGSSPLGGPEAYGFHALEVLQCMVERRVGGETGVAAVTCLEGDAVWRSAEEGLWSRELAEAACGAIEAKPEGRMEEHCENPALFIVEYRDGLRGAALMLPEYVHDLAYAAQAEGEVVATEFFAQGHGDREEDKVISHAHFSYLSLNVEEMFLTGQPQYPAERTLLTSGVLEAALDSRLAGHQRRETPWLDVAYRSYDTIPWRPQGTRPTGASLDPWPPAS